MLMCYLSTITKGANSLNEVCCLVFAGLLRNDDATVYCTFQLHADSEVEVIIIIFYFLVHQQVQCSL